MPPSRRTRPSQPDDDLPLSGTRREARPAPGRSRLRFAGARSALAEGRERVAQLRLYNWKEVSGMQRSQTEVGPGDSCPDDRSRIERARDDMPADVYDELLKQALELASAS